MNENQKSPIDKAIADLAKDSRGIRNLLGLVEAYEIVKKATDYGPAAVAVRDAIAAWTADIAENLGASPKDITALYDPAIPPESLVYILLDKAPRFAKILEPYMEPYID